MPRHVRASFFVVVVLLPAGCGEATPTGKRSAMKAPTATDKEVLQHPFWKTPPTQKQLDAVVDLLRDPAVTGIFRLDENFKLRKTTLTDPGEGTRHIAFDAANASGFYDDNQKGTSRAQALGFLKQFLDREVEKEKFDAKAKKAQAR